MSITSELPFSFTQNPSQQSLSKQIWQKYNNIRLLFTKRSGIAHTYTIAHQKEYYYKSATLHPLSRVAADYREHSRLSLSYLKEVPTVSLHLQDYLKY